MNLQRKEKFNLYALHYVMFYLNNAIYLSRYRNAALTFYYTKRMQEISQSDYMTSIGGEMHKARLMYEQT